MMIRILFILCFCFFATIGYSQEEIHQTERTHNFSISLVGGPITQSFYLNDEHLTNESSYSAGLWLDYQIKNFFFVKTGVEKSSRISISDFSFESYQIPFLLGYDFLFGKSNNSNIKLQGEFGTYYRIINDFTNPSPIDYQVNNQFGLQASFGIKYDVSDAMFAIISLRTNRDLGDILETNDSSLKIKSGSGLEIGFGFRL